MNENQFHQLFLNPWHMPSPIPMPFGPWRPIFIVQIQFSHIFPASAWSPYQSLFLRHEIEKGTESGLGRGRHVQLRGQKLRCLFYILYNHSVFLQSFQGSSMWNVHRRRDGETGRSLQVDKINSTVLPPEHHKVLNFLLLVTGTLYP